MQEKMIFQVGLLAESSRANMTFERPWSTVHIHMRSQITGCWERFCTQTTFVWLFLWKKMFTRLKYYLYLYIYFNKKKQQKMKEISGTIFKTRKCLLGCWLFAVRDAMEKHLIYPKCYFIMPYACFLFYIYISAFNSFF